MHAISISQQTKNNNFSSLDTLSDFHSFFCFEILVKYQILKPGINPKSHVKL